LTLLPSEIISFLNEHNAVIWRDEMIGNSFFKNSSRGEIDFIYSVPVAGGTG